MEFLNLKNYVIFLKMESLWTTIRHVVFKIHLLKLTNLKVWFLYWIYWSFKYSLNQWRTTFIIYYLEQLYTLLLEILVLGQWLSRLLYRVLRGYVWGKVVSFQIKVNFFENRLSLYCVTMGKHKWIDLGTSPSLFPNIFA